MMEGKWARIQNSLTQYKSASPQLLYIVITDMNGKPLISDRYARSDFLISDAVTIENLSKPKFIDRELESSDEIACRFEIFTARLNKDWYQEIGATAKKGEPVFDTYWDIVYSDTRLGRLRTGFSTQGMRHHLTTLISGILITGFFVLIVTLGLIMFGVRRCLQPLEEFVKQLKKPANATDANHLFQHLTSVASLEAESDIKEISELKRVFLKLATRLASNWSQLEGHQKDCKDLVELKTRELHDLNKKLVQQIKRKKKIETRLITVQKLEAVGTLAGGIAHEFNNLFMAITGNATLIQKQSEPGHPNVQKAEKIRELVDKGSESIKQLLGFAKGGKYAPGPLNINEIIRVNLEMFARTRKDITINCKYEPEIWSIHADRSQMEHIVMNLLLNASQAMPESGSISIDTQNIVLHNRKVAADRSVSGRFIRLGIQDQGKGIAKEHIQRIFDPFFTTRMNTSGAGLGLASVYGIVDNHSGFITVESTVGKGALFCVFLPALHQSDENVE